MSVYMVFSFTVTDPEGFATYGLMAKPVLAKYDAVILAADFEAEALEGRALGANVIIRFPSKEQAAAFYNDPDYAQAKALRMQTTKDQHLLIINSVPFAT